VEHTGATYPLGDSPFLRVVCVYQYLASMYSFMNNAFLFFYLFYLFYIYTSKKLPLLICKVNYSRFIISPTEDIAKRYCEYIYKCITYLKIKWVILYHWCYTAEKYPFSFPQIHPNFICKTRFDKCFLIQSRKIVSIKMVRHLIICFSTHKILNWFWGFVV
jgi:hypothetical protein